MSPCYSKRFLPGKISSVKNHILKLWPEIYWGQVFQDSYVVFKLTQNISKLYNCKKIIHYDVHFFVHFFINFFLYFKRNMCIFFTYRARRTKKKKVNKVFRQRKIKIIFGKIAILGNQRGKFDHYFLYVYDLPLIYTNYCQWHESITQKTKYYNSAFLRLKKYALYDTDLLSSSHQN